MIEFLPTILFALSLDLCVPSYKERNFIIGLEDCSIACCAVIKYVITYSDYTGLILALILYI